MSVTKFGLCFDVNEFSNILNDLLRLVYSEYWISRMDNIYDYEPNLC